jgi:hypothetical protein
MFAVLVTAYKNVSTRTTVAKQPFKIVHGILYNILLLIWQDKDVIISWLATPRTDNVQLSWSAEVYISLPQVCYLDSRHTCLLPNPLFQVLSNAAAFASYSKGGGVGAREE